MSHRLKNVVGKVALGLLAMVAVAFVTLPMPTTRAAGAIVDDPPADQTPSEVTAARVCDDGTVIPSDIGIDTDTDAEAKGYCERRNPPSTYSGTRAGADATDGAGTGCTNKPTFFGLPTWYKYLKTTEVKQTNTNFTECVPKIVDLKDIWLVAAAVIEILLRVSALLAIVVILYGGYTYITSDGSEEKATKGQKMVVNAAVGLVISIVAVALVSFIAGRF